jgi:hypothetical protein
MSDLQIAQPLEPDGVDTSFIIMVSATPERIPTTLKRVALCWT